MNLHTANNKFWEANNEFVEGGGGSGGFKCVTSYTTLTDESVTTVEEGGQIGALLTYSDFIDADTLKITFDGTEYICEKIILEDNVTGYGGISGGEPDFTEYPFVIFSANEEPSSNAFATPTEGTYQVKIETPRETIETTPCFDKAVKSLANILTVKFSVTANPAVYEGDKTAAEVKEVLESGGLVLFIMPPAGLNSTRIDIVNYIVGNQKIDVQHMDNNTPNYAINGDIIEANLD